MEIGFLHLHKTVAIIFAALLLSKVILLMAGRFELLRKLRDKTRVAEMILGGLIIITGFYLFFLKSHPEFYLYAKIFLVLLSVPLGIIGLKRQKSILALLSLLVIFYIYFISETRSLGFRPPKFDVSKAMTKEPAVSEGEVIYHNLCADCHGIDGKKGLFKAPDLTASKLTSEQKLEIIKNGQGVMQSYSRRLSAEEMDLVLEYISHLGD